ncbi:hypothetical protein D8674_016052 [Pyrus ussuriensis x Pyrus communis]|uniref:Uncharacterized protein n=1 Tax=Pyrus ussuriensis x Pyrus communis TaxID=2448454 RepID=A0A5N5HE29_9ROSA|nr:hypothetical protein D8674_016052 [Pyrus ussuriensis x Pyrus communis]
MLGTAVDRRTGRFAVGADRLDDVEKFEWMMTTVLTVDRARKNDSDGNDDRCAVLGLLRQLVKDDNDSTVKKYNFF